MLKVLIIDNEPTTSVNLHTLLQSEPDIDIVGVSASISEAISALHCLHPDIVFLDIRLPCLSGLDIVNTVSSKRRSHIVFLGTFDKSAVTACEVHDFDYLIKPVESRALAKILFRLRERCSVVKEPVWEKRPLLKFIPCNGYRRIYLLPMAQVIFVGSRMSGVYVTSLDGKEGFTSLTLRTLEHRTPLVQCHRQYLVNMDHLKEIRLTDNGQAVLLLNSDQYVPVSRRYLRLLKEMLCL